MKLLRLIRIDNLLLLAFVQLIFRYGFLEYQAQLPIALEHWQYALLILSCVCIAAGGFLINAVLDRGHPADYPEAKAYNIYALLNIIGVGIGFYLSNYIGKPGFATLFIIVAATLYIYASSLRQSLLIGNFIIAVIVALSVLIVGIFNLYPVIIPENQGYLGTIFELFIDYAIFGFLITFLRELVKDLRDTDIDYNSGRSTLPIILGRERAAKVVFFLAFIPLGLLLYYADVYMLNLLWSLIYLLLFIAGPIIYFIIKLWGAKTPKDLDHLALVLKLVLVFAAISIAVIIFDIIYHA